MNMMASGICFQEKQEVIIEKVIRNKRKSITTVKGLDLFGVFYVALKLLFIISSYSIDAIVIVNSVFFVTFQVSNLVKLQRNLGKSLLQEHLLSRFIIF